MSSWLDLPVPRSARAPRATPPDVAEAVHYLERAEAILARRSPGPILTELAALRERLISSVTNDDTAPVKDAGPALSSRLELPVITNAPRLARSFCRKTCVEWDLAPQVVSTVTDLASELVANAVRHTRSPMRLLLERNLHSVVISVWDDGVGVPHLLPYRPGISERGLGLRLVKQLSSDWGWARADEGKWVWARIPLTAGDASGGQA